MLLNVLSRGVVLTDSMRAAMQRKLDFALDRFGDRLERVEVTIEDLNGPRGGVDKRVRLLLSGPSQVLGRIMERRNRLAHRSQ
jgi:putative sigma-54 modulation protein